MDETAGTAAVVHESHSFACMRCGHGWEQSHEIQHHTDGGGTEFVTYVTAGRVVPSPLRRPTCDNCDSHVVRIMRAGQVASALNAARRTTGKAPPAAPPAGPVEAPAAGRDDAGRHHRHLSGLLHPFQHHRAG